MVIPGPKEPTQREMRAFLIPLLHELKSYGPGGGIQVTASQVEDAARESGSDMSIDGHGTIQHRTFKHTVFLTGVFADTPARWASELGR